LSAREREVLVALAEGLTNRELADRLFISERTANRHLSNIFTKLGVHNRLSAARVAREAGLV
jgi:DNA-binding NarL/FixJ family response regulator